MSWPEPYLNGIFIIYKNFILKGAFTVIVKLFVDTISRDHKMQQLAGPLSLLNPLILQQVAAYGNYNQVNILFL